LETASRANGSDTSAWEGLEALRPHLRVTMARRCRDENELDDVVQETLIRAARFRDRLSDPKRLRAWSARIASNVHRDQRRRERLLPTASDGPELLDGSPAKATGEPSGAGSEPGVVCSGWYVDQELALGQMRQAFEELPVQDRRVLRAFYAGPGRSRDTAAECGLPVGVVKARLYRARRRLERLMRRRLTLLSRERFEELGVVQ
jgi:RNA polymerase sigma-70 factor (ECF subfamily)